MQTSAIQQDTVQARRRALALGLLAALLGRPALARAAPPTLTLALIELMPWTSTNAQGQQVGILITVAETLATLSGIELRLRLLPYPRAALMLQNGEVDLMVALQAERLDHIASRMAPLSAEDIVVVGPAGSVLRSLADLKGKTVGRLRYAEYDPDFAARTEILKYDTNSYRQSLEMLRAGRLDAVVFIRSALLYTLKSMHLSTADVGTPLFINRAPLTMYATRACAASAAGAAMREACNLLFRRETIKALAAMFNTAPDASALAARQARFW